MTDRHPVPERADGIGRQTTLIVAARLYAASCTAVLAIVLARALGPEEFGIYALAITIATLVGLVAELGIGPASARFVAERLAAGAPVARVIRESLTTKTMITGGALVVVLVGADLLARPFDHPDLAPLLRIAGVGIVFADLFGWLAAMFEALRLARRQVLMIGVKASSELLIVLLLLSAGSGTTGAVLGNAAGFALAVAVGLAMLRSAAPAVPHAAGVGASALVGYGIHIWVAGLAWVAFDRVDQIMLGALRDASSVALYEAPWRLVTFLTLTTTALAAVVGPRLVGATPSRAGELAAGALRFALLLAIPIASIVTVVADDLVAVLLGAPFAGAATVLRSLMVFLVLVSLAPILSRSLDYLGAARSRRWIAIATFGTNLLLDAILIPTIGVVGPAIASTVAATIFVTGHLVLLRRAVHIDWRGIRRACVHAVGVAAVSAGAAGLVQLLPIGSAAQLVGATTVGSAAGLATAAHLRSLPRSGVTRSRRRAPRPDATALVATCGVAAAAAVVATRAPIVAVAILAGVALAALLVRDAVLGLATFVAIAPLTQLPAVAGVTGQGAKLAGALLVAGWLLAWSRGQLRQPSPAVGATVLPLALLVGWVASSLAWADSTSSVVTALGRWIPVALLLVIAATAVDRPRALRAVAGGVAVAGVTSIVAAAASGTAVIEGRLGGATGDPNLLAAALVPSVLLAAALSATSRSWRRGAWGATAVTSAAGLLFTGSRGGLIALVAAGCVLLAIGGPWRRGIARAAVTSAVVAIGVVTLAVPSDVRERFVTLGAAAERDGGTGRTDIWRVALRAAGDDVAVGAGAGNYTAAVRGQLDEPGLIRRPDLVLGDTKVAHNTYLHVLVETGIVGLALFIAVIVCALGAASRALRRGGREGDPSELVVRAALAGTIGLLVANLFISGQYEVELWAMLGLCVAAPAALGASAVGRRSEHVRRDPSGWILEGAT